MRNQVFASLLFVSALVLAATPAAGQQIHYGPESPLGQGTARTYVLIGDDPCRSRNRAQRTALEGLPDLADVPPTRRRSS